MEHLFDFNGWKVYLDRDGEPLIRAVGIGKNKSREMIASRVHLGPVHAPVEVEALPAGSSIPIAVYGHDGMFFFSGRAYLALNAETARLYASIPPVLAAEPEAAEVLDAIDFAVADDRLAAKVRGTIEAVVRARKARDG